jgi:membrane protease YdiL (CAAX protease family)
VIALIAMLVLVRRFDEQRWRWWFAADGPLGASVLRWALSMFAIVCVGDKLLGAVLGEPIPIPGDPVRAAAASSAVAFVLGAILGPLLEELGFRGLLFSSVSKCLGSPIAVVASAGLFAVAHVGFSGPAIAVVAWFGVAMAIGYELSGSVWPPVICHAAFNACELVAPLVW